MEWTPIGEIQFVIFVVLFMMKSLWYPPHLHGDSHQFILAMVNIFATIILYDHVMHDDTCRHDIPKAILIPKSRRSPNNSKLGLQNPKSSLHIFPSRRLSRMKTSCFFTFGRDHRLHKCLPPRVDAVGKKIAVVVLVAICFELYFWTFTQCKPCHQW